MEAVENSVGFHHLPVLLEECIAGLCINPLGAYLDCTLGGAGHSSEILKRLDHGGLLVGIDRDEEALNASKQRLSMIGSDACFRLLHGNFHDVPVLLKDAGILCAFSGILVDLCVSSHQLDVRERGFSYHADAPLDMRMDQNQPLRASDIVNNYSEDELTRIIGLYGEEKWARQIARVICDRRRSAPISTTARLVDIIDAAVPKKLRLRDSGHPARRTFQALRIAVNDELDPLEGALRRLADMLVPGGRLCVITFHSLEDRIVKTTFHSLSNPCTCPKSFPVCVCGKKPTVKLITRKPITPSEHELTANARSRSACLRIVEKL